MSKLKVRIEENIENKSCLSTKLDPKTDFETHPRPKNNPLGPQKDPTIKSIQKSELKDMWKKIVVQLYE